MTAGPHYSREFAEARLGLGHVLDHLDAAGDVETSILEGQLLGIRDDIVSSRRVRVERARVRDISLVEVACDHVARALAQLAVDVTLATTDVY
jgi:hypothetical protein